MSLPITAVAPIVLTKEDSRLTTFPINRPALFAWYQDATKCYWTVDEINISEDAFHYETKLTPGEKHFVKHVLAFFAASDGIVNMNLAKRFKKDVAILEANYFYDFQIAIENVHAHTYSLLLETIIPGRAERDDLLNAITTMPIITKMSQYMFKCIASDASFAERLLRMACVEGIFFTGCFCVIYWLRARGLMPGLGHSNELISRDEALHTMFALFLYTIIKPGAQLPRERVNAVFREAVDLATEFIHEALPVSLPEMNAELMISYIQCQADNLLALIELPPIYGAKHNFAFMDQQNMANRTNFFERRVSEYAKPCTADKSAFDVALDF
jgi:ribonucleotide reductase beta subunit family protein with ferritin-like domain